MEPDCKALIDKYVRSDSVIACLELSGYTSALLIRNLDSNQIDQIEEFVRHACTVMNPTQARSFLGNVFSCHADKFCFPIGVRMGLMLAVNELKSLNNNLIGCNSRSPDKIVQTDITIGCSFTSFLNPNLHFFNKLTSNAILCDQPQLRFGNDLSSSSTPKSSIDQASDGINDNTEIHSKSLIKPDTSFDLSLRVVNNNINNSSSPEANQQRRSTSGSAITHDINIEHLKQHSSASAIRLASRQFINANLVQNRHFKIDMEVNPTAEGPLRVTGIFNCHLCRQKRDRSTPVRFSIARNRYPVMSNVLSHLKIHFQPLLVSPPHDGAGSGCGGADSISDARAQRLIKQENLVYSQSDSSVGVDSLSPFNLDHLIMAGGAFGPAEMKMFPSSGPGGCAGPNE